MAMFGFVYLWYLMAVLVVEIWLDYRRDIVLMSQSSHGWKRLIYRALTLGSDNISERALEIDERVGWLVTVIGIPSAFLLHGYVGFIFGSVKANPWWSTPLMPVVFLFSAMVSGIAAVLLLYMFLNWLRRVPIDMRCVDTVARYLFYTFIIDFSLEMLDLIHRIYEADESFRSLDFMVHTRLFTSQVVIQILAGTVLPIGLLALTQVLKLPEMARKRIYSACGLADPDRHLRHALECRHRRAAILQELSRIHDLQDGLCYARRTVGGHRAVNPSTLDPGGAGETPAAVAGEGHDAGAARDSTPRLAPNNHPNEPSLVGDPEQHGANLGHPARHDSLKMSGIRLENCPECRESGMADIVQAPAVDGENLPGNEAGFR